MLELLNETVLWWHWIIFGVILLILEMFTGTFLMLGLGMAAIIVGILDTLFHTSFTTDLTIWSSLSIIVVIAWFKWFKKQPTVSNVGQSNYGLNTLGSVTQNITAHQRGKVKFDTPVLGNTTWHATANKNIDKDKRVKIVEIKGQLILVEQI